MRRTSLLWFILVTCMVGCMEGRKPTPLARAGVSARVPPTSAKETLPEIKPPPPEPKPPLYQQIGGAEVLKQIVDDFAATAAEDENIPEAHRKLFTGDDAASYKKLVIDVVADLTGGPKFTPEETLKKRAEGQDISMKEFDAFLADFQKALEKNKIGEADQSAVLALLKALSKDVVKPTE
jgi:truncated hemoglobin YjbI